MKRIVFLILVLALVGSGLIFATGQQEKTKEITLK